MLQQATAGSAPPSMTPVAGNGLQRIQEYNILDKVILNQNYLQNVQQLLDIIIDITILDTTILDTTSGIEHKRQGDTSRN